MPVRARPAMRSKGFHGDISGVEGNRGEALAAGVKVVLGRAPAQADDFTHAPGCARAQRAHDKRRCRCRGASITNRRGFGAEVFVAEHARGPSRSQGAQADVLGARPVWARHREGTGSPSPGHR